jgi:hypothetical protein
VQWQQDMGGISDFGGKTMNSILEVTVIIFFDKKPWWLFYLLQSVNKDMTLDFVRFKRECDVDYLEQCYKAPFKVEK